MHENSFLHCAATYCTAGAASAPVMPQMQSGTFPMMQQAVRIMLLRQQRENLLLFAVEHVVVPPKTGGHGLRLY